MIPALLWLIERLARRHEVRVFSLYHFERPRTFELLGARVQDLGLLGRKSIPGMGLWNAGHLLRRALAAAGPLDVLHAFWAETPGFLAVRAGHRLAIPVVVSLAGGELVAFPREGYGSARTWKGRFLVRQTLASAHRVTAASGPMVRLAERSGVRAELVPLGVPTEFFASPMREEGPPWRLLHVADLNPAKDQDTLLRALERIVAAEPATHLDIVGRDTLGGRIQRSCADRGLSGHVTFHGFRPGCELPAFYSRAHILVHSSLHEAGPLVALEAAAAGLPTVGTDVGQIADWAPERAVAVPVGDDASLADAVLALLRDPARRLDIGEIARSWAREHDADETARRFEEIYSELAGARPRRGADSPLQAAARQPNRSRQ